ncbi:MAG: SRPBCC domain-containing protein [Proteobacteria bacterium]|nr:SRPBCC domain-containing protein [Pseudomonadota bacterium]
MIRVAAVCASVGALACGSWETEAVVTIEAPPTAVWAVLTDLDAYPDWNSYSPRAEGELREGGVVTIDAQLGDEVRIVSNRVTRLDRERALCWHSLNWYGFLARGTRCRLLEPVGNGATHFRHHEIMEGPLAGLVERLYRPRIDAGLARMNADLKRTAEARSQ